MKIDFSNRELYNYKYIPILHNKKRYIFLMWWAWSWKSVFQAQKEIIKSFEFWNKLMVIRKIRDTHKDSTFSELKSVINKWDLIKYFDWLPAENCCPL
jgi:phage terminase large subunit